MQHNDIPAFMRPGEVLTNYSGVAVRVHATAFGGMGLVAFGPDEGQYQGRWFALKTMRPDKLVGAARDRFISEGLTWRGVWYHANLMQAQFVTEIAGVPFLVLDYAEHGNLRDLLRRAAGPLPLPTAFTIVQHIAAGLAALHTPDPDHLRGVIIHRDLKPENVLIRQAGQGQLVVITDFGLAKAVAGDDGAALQALAGDAPSDPTHTAAFHTQYGVAMGTLAYMPPEQWRDAASAKEAADVYAVGCIIGELFLGRHPLLPLNGRASSEQWLTAHLQGERALLPGVVPVPVQEAYEASLDPAQRPTAAALLAALQRGARAIQGCTPYTPPEIYPPTNENERDFWLGWAGAYLTFNRYGEAWERIERAYMLAPRHPKVLLSRGNILAGQGDVAGAMAMYQAPLAERPLTDKIGRRSVYNQIGILHKNTGQYAEAEGAYAAGLDLIPDDAAGWYNRANNQRLWAEARAAAGDRAGAREHAALARTYIDQALSFNEHAENRQRLRAAIVALQGRLG